jgi:purine-binding chemotaxis protein CheW
MDQIQGADIQLVVFDLADEVYGVDIARVDEVIRMPAITRIPRAPEFVEGVTNLRGKVIPVVDLRRRFGLAMADIQASSRIVVVYIGSHTIGLIVDGVSEVIRVASSAIEPPSTVVTSVDSAYLRGIAKVDDRLVILLDLDYVLGSAEKDRLVDAVSQAAGGKPTQPREQAAA